MKPKQNELIIKLIHEILKEKIVSNKYYNICYKRKSGYDGVISFFEKIKFNGEEILLFDLLRILYNE